MTQYFEQVYSVTIIEKMAIMVRIYNRCSKTTIDANYKTTPINQKPEMFNT